MKLTKRQKNLVVSYARSILSGFLTILLLGVNDLKDVWTAFVAAIVPVLIRALNKKDPLNRDLPTEDEVQAAIDAAVSDALAKKVAEDKAKAAKKAAAAKKTAAK